MFGAKQCLLKTGERRKYPPGRGGRVKRSSRDHKWPLRRKVMYRTQKKPDTDENHARGCVPNYVLWQAKASKLVTTQEKARDVWGKTMFIENRRKKIIPQTHRNEKEKKIGRKKKIETVTHNRMWDSREEMERRMSSFFCVDNLR